MSYKFKAAPGAGYNDKQAQQIGDYLESLPTIDPATVVLEAANPKCFLHQFFEWDDESAADQHRLSQARQLINHLQVILKGDHGEFVTKAYHSIRIEVCLVDKPVKVQRVYVHTQVVRQDRFMSDQVIARAANELKIWRTRYDEYKSLFGAAIDTVKKAETTLRNTRRKAKV